MKSSESFDNIKFKGTFRIYQQRILDNAGKYLRDKKLNIVAAPGSGKTILGLEFICRLKAPCLILSPTTTIREQWGRRFEECFLPENENLNDYVSYNLNKPQLINSITYQALYSAINKIQINEEDETDCSDIDLFKVIKETGIKTICLDEAHHLQNEWQKSLEKFVSLLDKDIVIISLTATPPYDSSPAEWNRYINLCGEIDDEIFVPELVKEGTLCPHQDYVYFNYPTEDELKEIKQQREANKAAIYEILDLPFIANELVSRIELIYKNNEDYFYKNYILFLRCLVFVSLTKKERALKAYKEITKQKKIPPFNLERCQAAVQFILESEEICNKDEKKAIRSILEKYSALERNKVCLNLNERLKKKIVSSAGKLNSISQIVKAEYSSLGSKLRMLILTDYIKKDAVKSIGSEKSINNISVVSIFNELFKQKEVKIGVVSGSLVILPLKAAEIFDEKKIK
ncbi:MAG: DEAD/DEAH box helicase family protein, partial [Spirochaetaceae bacterium]|nr:DEAD/DEAH box helicase family protein [Spirochaetaceae bacterium]